jgi:hypothetical protein
LIETQWKEHLLRSAKTGVGVDPFGVSLPLVVEPLRRYAVLVTDAIGLAFTRHSSSPGFLPRSSPMTACLDAIRSCLRPRGSHGRRQASGKANPSGAGEAVAGTSAPWGCGRPLLRIFRAREGCGNRVADDRSSPRPLRTGRQAIPTARSLPAGENEIGGISHPSLDALPAGMTIPRAETDE